MSLSARSRARGIKWSWTPVTSRNKVQSGNPKCYTGISRKGAFIRNKILMKNLNILFGIECLKLIKPA